MKKRYRFFGGHLKTQERWLNQMSDKGYRLVRTGRLMYEFERCEPGKVRYCMEFIGQKSKENAEDYREFLEDMGYRVFCKNINLGYSIGKARWRPWAEKGGRIATDFTTRNRELLIVEKENDGRPFELHTSCEDKGVYYSVLRNLWLFTLVLFAVAALVCHSVIFGALTLAAIFPTALYEGQVMAAKREQKIREW